MNPKHLFFALASAALLCSCQGQGEQSSSSEQTQSLDEHSDYIAAYLRQDSSYYRIVSTYRLAQGDSSVGSGSSTKQVYLGKDAAGFDAKIEWLSGSRRLPAGLEDNDGILSESHSIYHTPSQTYTRLENGSYKIEAAAHPDIAPYPCPFALNKGEGIANKIEGNQMIVSGSVADGEVSAFLGSAIAGKKGIHDLSFRLSFTKEEAYLQEVALSFSKSGFSVSQTFAFSSENSPIVLPS